MHTPQLSEEENYYYQGSLKEARDRYAEEETARILGREEGREEGVTIEEKRKAVEIAQQQMPLETILQLTGLTAEELQPFLSAAQN